MLGAQAVEREAHSHARERCRGACESLEEQRWSFLSAFAMSLDCLFVGAAALTTPHHAATTTTHRDTNTLRVSTCCTTVSAVGG